MWLSEKLESGPTSYGTADAAHVSIVERFQRLVRPFNSFTASLLLAVCLVAMMIAPSVAAGFLAPVPGPPQGADRVDSSDLGGTLLTVAEVLSGVSGILFAVIVFGIQFHGERLGHTSFLIHYFGRREAVLPLAAATLAVVGANVLTSLLAQAWQPAAAVPMAAVDLVMVPAVLIVTLWLLHRMIASISGDFLDDSMVSWLLWEYSLTVQDEVYLGRMQAAFTTALQDLGHCRDCVDSILRRTSATSVEFSLRRPGRISDVNLWEVASLVGLVRNTWGPDVEFEFPLVPGGTAGGAVTLRLFIPRRAGADSASEVTAKQRSAIQGALRKVFRVSHGRVDDFPELLRRFTKALASQAAHDRADECLAVLEKLITFRLEHPELPRVTNGVSPSLPSYFDEFKLFDMARAAVGAWCVYVAKVRPDSSGAAVAVARQVIEGFDTQAEMLRVWEQRPDAEDGGGLAAIDSWSLDRQPLRAGEFRVEANPGSWLLDGFVALLLAKHTAVRVRTPGWLKEPPAHQPPPEILVNAAIASVLDDAHLREGILGIDEASRADAARKVAELFAGRRRRLRIRELRDVVTSEVTPGLVEAVRRSVEESLPDTREWLAALTALGPPDVGADSWQPPAIQVRTAVPKQFLLREHEDSSSLGSGIAEALRRRKRIPYSCGRRRSPSPSALWPRWTAWLRLSATPRTRSDAAASSPR
jgi:hypothetical protein